MFNNDSTHEDASLTELYAEVLGPEKTDNVMITFDAGEFTFTVEFANFDHGKFFNVASMPTGTNYPEKLADEVDREITDVGDIYVEFKTDTDDAGVAIDELLQIASAMDVSTEAIAEKKRRS